MHFQYYLVIACTLVFEKSEGIRGEAVQFVATDGHHPRLWTSRFQFGEIVAHKGGFEGNGRTIGAGGFGGLKKLPGRLPSRIIHLAENQANELKTRMDVEYFVLVLENMESFNSRFFQ